MNAPDATVAPLSVDATQVDGGTMIAAVLITATVLTVLTIILVAWARRKENPALLHTVAIGVGVAAALVAFFGMVRPSYPEDTYAYQIGAAEGEGATVEDAQISTMLSGGDVEITRGKEKMTCKVLPDGAHRAFSWTHFAPVITGKVTVTCPR